jgi:hypothetical protein
MKQRFLRNVLTLVLCTSLAVLFVTTVSPAKSAHAAPASPANCGDVNMSRGFNFLPGQSVNNHTCAGTSLHLIYQTDGNFVLYIGGQAKWASNTSFGVFCPLCKDSHTEFQSDGNLVVYNINSFEITFAAWASNTANRGATRLSLQTDGNLVIYNASNQPLWASHTCCWR